jgi:hypothetical protein
VALSYLKEGSRGREVLQVVVHVQHWEVRRLRDVTASCVCSGGLLGYGRCVSRLAIARTLLLYLLGLGRRLLLFVGFMLWSALLSKLLRWKLCLLTARLGDVDLADYAFMVVDLLLHGVRLCFDVHFPMAMLMHWLRDSVPLNSALNISRSHS